MYRKVMLVCLLLCSPQVLASKLSLECYLHPGNDVNQPVQSQLRDVELVGNKAQPLGAAKVFSLAPYEFWVMNGAIMTMNDVSDVLWFQVAIKNTDTGEFYHAMSNERMFLSKDALKARLSLVKYHEGTMQEKAEILYECNTPLE
ncbi:hypothetical protein JCM19237_5021 [Photobacterium aphoticum]|uniref:Uncharacterized protein n=1 Tax=Photobacterium aphoticum TaxID=754436 RepID=A0A090QIQ4_9GAMM|nr:hypothetical protein JCM19237_5021 [Photobacterium aphoticum]